MLEIIFKDSIQDLEGFVVVEDSEGKIPTRKGQYDGMNFPRRGGFFRYMLFSERDLLPEVLHPYVLQISAIFAVNFKALGERKFGEYVYRSATATLDANSSNAVIEIIATSVDDVRELYRQIRAGEIAPVKNWRQPQVEASKDDQPGEVLC